MDGPWPARPEGGLARACREWTSVLPGRRRGDLWTNPGEAVQSGDRLDRRTGRCRERRHRRSGGSCSRLLYALVRALSEGPRRRADVRKRGGERPEGGWKADTHNFARGFPPISRQSPGNGWAASVMARGKPRSAGCGYDPEDPMNPIPDRLPGRA